jgi:hypothetical protein
MKPIKSWSIFKSWRTTACGAVCIVVGIWSAYVHYVPTTTPLWNFIYVLNAQEALLGVGIGLIHARDHKA